MYLDNLNKKFKLKILRVFIGYALIITGLLTLTACRSNENDGSIIKYNIAKEHKLAAYSQMGIKTNKGFDLKQIIEVPGGDLWIDALHHGPA